MKQKINGIIRAKNEILHSVLLGLFAVVLLSACSAKSLPAGFNEDAVNSQAKQVVTQLSNQEFAPVEAQFADILKPALPAGTLKTALGAMITNLGEFKEFGSSSMGSSENPQVGKFAVVVIQATYANGKATYTISIDEAGKLTGLYMK